MIIRSLELRNFRNYHSLDIEFHPNTNVLYGDNAQGKTNILESVYVSGTTKSHKGSKDKEMIQIGAQESHIRMYVEKNEIVHKIDMHLKRGKGKGIAIDGIPIKRSTELLGLLHIIFFSPEDLTIIKNGPGERRRFLNMELSQLDKVYVHHLTEYNKILANRNKLLKQIYHDTSLLSTLDIWDKQLCQYGKKIIEVRSQFIEELKEIVEKTHYQLSGGRENLVMHYEPDVEVEEYENALLKSRDRDLATFMTNTGPHRDDISFLIGDIDIRRFGSQGQQRTCALSLKLSEIALVKRKIKQTPVLLLDDVMSELDRNRQNYLLENIHDIQTIITCTGLEEFIDKNMIIDTVYHVENGCVRKKEMPQRKIEMKEEAQE